MEPLGIFDSLSPYDLDDKSSFKEREDSFTSHYLTIGHTISICESASIKVGIPCLFPTKKIRSLKASYYGQLEDFIRIQLVGVPTVVLESYIDDLLEHFDEDCIKPTSKLFIHSLTLLEKYGCMSLFSIFSLFLAYYTSSLYSSNNSTVILATIIVGTISVSLSILVNSEIYRATSFAMLLRDEVSRRMGSSSTQTKLRICPSS
jgi:hypothetical protein